MTSPSPPSNDDLTLLSWRIRPALTPELLKSPYKEQWTTQNPTFGFCAIAGEVAWFLFGGKQKGWVARVTDLWE